MNVPRETCAFFTYTLSYIFPISKLYTNSKFFSTHTFDNFKSNLSFNNFFYFQPFPVEVESTHVLL